MKKRLAILICIAMVFTLVPTYAIAKDGDYAKSTELKTPQTITNNKAPLQKPEGKNNIDIKDQSLDKFIKYAKKDITWDSENEFILINRPKWNEVIYQGEKIWTDYYQADTWQDWNTIPVEVVFNSNDDIVFYNEYWDAIVPADDYARWTGKVDINSKKLKPGRYQFMVINAPADEYGYPPENWVDFEDIPYDYNDFTIKQFNKPTKLKVTAGKKKVTVRFRGTTGATKYQVYRSTKKNKNYKKIKTTTKKKFVDKKVKKGKRYYYKVRAIRKVANKNQIISKFTTPKRSKKVKK